MILTRTPNDHHFARGRARVRIAVCALAVGLAFALPAVADAATWTEGTSARAFGLVTTPAPTTKLGPFTDPKGGQSLVLPYLLLTQNQPSGIKPRSIQPLPSGSILVADWDNYRVYEITTAGALGWTYDTMDGVTLHRPISASRVPSGYTGAGNTLIVDRAGYQVIEVTPTKTNAWTYGTESLPGTDANQLSDPWWAVRLASGNTLITDGAGGNRVIEVSHDGTITWQYGVVGESSTALGRLVLPTSAERLANGNTLIADSGGNRIIEVNPAKAIVWSYAGTGTSKLSSPHHATRLANGRTLITDNGNKRVIEVDGSGALVATYGSGVQLPTGGGLSDPWTSARLADGTTLVADPLSAKILKYGYAANGTAESNKIDCSAPGVRKKFLSVTWRATLNGGSVAVYYSIDGSTYKQVPTSGKLPSFAVGTYMRYKVTLSRGTYATAPVLHDISVGWQVAPTSTGSGVLPQTGTNTSGGSGEGSNAGTGTANPSFVGTSTLGTTETVVDDGIRRGFVMAEVKAGSGGGPGVHGPDAGAPMTTQLAGLALLTVVFSTGIGYGPFAGMAPKLIHMAGALLK
jgi:hypothetical protein